MNWTVGDKFLVFNLAFLNGNTLGIIVLYKNVNYKLLFKTVPVFSVTFTKEVFNQTYYHKITKTPVIVQYDWNGYKIYSMNKTNKHYISADRNFVPLKLLQTT